MQARGDGGDWSVKSYMCSKQEDGDSCGVFVLMVSLNIALQSIIVIIILKLYTCITSVYDRTACSHTLWWNLELTYLFELV